MNLRASDLRAEPSSTLLVSKKVRLLYSLLFIPLLRSFFFFVSFFDSKVRRGYNGRKNLFADLERSLSRIPGGTRIWFHASSFGEFEQAKPIIEILKKSGHRIVVSFFSPSGYEHALSYPNADVVTYIPFDSRRNAERFVKLVAPRAVVVMRYDLWMNHLIAVKEFGAKVVVADATFSLKLLQRATFMKDFYREVYGLADLILATNSENKKMFDFFLGTGKAFVVGDTRFDRVYNRSISNDVAQKIPVKIEKSGRVVMILGSTWRQDLNVVGDGIKRIARKVPGFLVLIVPHEPTSEEVRKLKEEFPNAKVMSEIAESQGDGAPVLIVDRVGILTQLYVLGDVAYVGGGFGAGVHSVLEPAVYGMPIITGPRIQRSDEAMRLMQEGALFFVKDSSSAYEMMLEMVENEKARKKAGKIAKEFVSRNIGASSIVAERIMKFCGD
jgi:3-deoxy-D-manno-octulosonic-acid transferase